MTGSTGAIDRKSRCIVADSSMSESVDISERSNVAKRSSIRRGIRATRIYRGIGRAGADPAREYTGIPQRLHSGIVIALALIFSGYLSTQTSWPVLLIVPGSWPDLWLLARVYFWRFTRTMEPAAIPNSPVACWRSMGRTINPTLLIGQTIFVGVLSGTSLYRAYQRDDAILWLLGGIIATALVPYVIALLSWRKTWMSTE